MTLMALGIAMTQAVSASNAVTLRWLRLGDLIALSLLPIAGVLAWMERGDEAATAALLPSVGVLAGFFLLHLILVQLGSRRGQRMVQILAVMVISAGAIAAGVSTASPITLTPFAPGEVTTVPLVVGLLMSSALLGGYLMTMLLGHAYLTAGGEMTQAPFQRLCVALLFALALRALTAAVFGLWPAVSERGDIADPIGVWPIMLMTVRFLVGVFVPFVMTWMALACVRIRSNQSATGILYVASILVLIGELTALSLSVEYLLAF